MENCLSKNPNINVVYTINEPTAIGAYAALKAAGKEQGALIVSIDGGCAGVKSVKDGIIGATSQQYPRQDGAARRRGDHEDRRRRREAATSSDGLDFFNTGVALVTDKPVDGSREHRHHRGAEDLLGLTARRPRRRRHRAAGPGCPRGPGHRLPTRQSDPVTHPSASRSLR